MGRPRIVALLHELSLTGAPRLTLDWLEGMRERYDLRIVSLEGGPLLGQARKLGPTVVLKESPFGTRLPGALSSEHVSGILVGASGRLKSKREMLRLRRWHPSLVYASTTWSLPLVRRLGLGDVPVVLHVMEIGSALRTADRANPGLLPTVPDHIAALSQAVAGDLVAMGVRADSVTVVRPHILSTVPASAEPRHHPDPIVVGGAGNPSWTKGMDLWLLAARRALDKLGPDRLRFVWLGVRENSEGLRFRTMISKLGLDGQVELVPETPKPYEQFARFDVYAMSSWEESASAVVIEAMAMGIPVVCFAPTGGPAEEVGDAGIVLPEMSPDQMAEAIVDLARSPGRRQALGRAGRERVRTEFSRQASIASLERVFEETMASPRRPS